MRKIGILLALMAGCTAGQSPGGPDSYNRVVDIVNTTAMPLDFRAVRAENRGLLPQPITGTIAPHAYQTINFDDGSGACLFDLTAQLQGGARVVASDFNTCSEVSWVIN
jgi:hypothetical protein